MMYCLYDAPVCLVNYLAKFGDFLAFFGNIWACPANFGGWLRRPRGVLGSATGNSPAPGGQIASLPPRRAKIAPFWALGAQRLEMP